MGLDRVLVAMEAEGAPVPPPRTVRCFVVAIGSEAQVAARRLVADLRSAGVPAARSFEERPLKAQLKMADRSGAAFAAIIGERELADGRVTLRRLYDGEQTTVDLADAAARLVGDGGGAS